MLRSALLALLLSSCGPVDEFEQLRARVAELELQLAAAGAAHESCEQERRLCLTRLEEATCGP